MFLSLWSWCVPAIAVDSSNAISSALVFKELSVSGSIVSVSELVAFRRVDG